MWGVQMKKIRIVIADGNVEYLNALAAFMRNAGETSKFIITFFSDLNKLTSYIDEVENIDILLISPEFYNQHVKDRLEGETTLIVLEDDKIANYDESVNVVYRYQRLNQLVSNMLAIYYEHNDVASELLARNKQAKVLSVYSPIGGSGKTTIAVNLCKQLALTGAKVFYLNLELFNSTKLYFTSAEDNPSLQIFYYIKTDSSQLHSKIETLKKYDPYSMVDYFDLAVNADEMLEISKNEVKKLINGIVGTGSYDYLVIDLDSSLHERNRAALQECDQIIWPIVNDVQSFFKSTSFLSQETALMGKENVIKDKMFIILNQYTGENVSGVEESGMTIDGYLPYISNWASIPSGSEILHDEMFNQEMQAIIHESIRKVKVGAVHGE